MVRKERERERVYVEDSHLTAKENLQATCIILICVPCFQFLLLFMFTWDFLNKNFAFWKLVLPSDFCDILYNFKNVED